MEYNVHEAKTQFSKLLAKAQSGEEVVIARAGQPIAKLVPIRCQEDRVSGLEKGRIWVAEDFDAPLPDDVLDSFEGKS
ncbi:MAG: type II toxin-antitoxin system Phd/YefM family antitoxin [Planctomycetota bacterium]